MLIEKADMLDAITGRFANAGFLADAVAEKSITLAYVAGWLDAIGTLVDVDYDMECADKKRNTYGDKDTEVDNE